MKSMTSLTNNKENWQLQNFLGTALTNAGIWVYESGMSIPQEMWVESLPWSMFLTLELPPSCSPGSEVFCPLFVVNLTQKVLLSWWHLNDWSLESLAELGMGQSGPVCHWQSWQYRIPVSVGLCQKRSVHYCHCLLLECLMQFV